MLPTIAKLSPPNDHYLFSFVSKQASERLTLSLEGMEDDVVYSPLSQLCRLINKTIITKSMEYLPRQAGDFSTLPGLICDQLVAVYLSKALLFLSLAILLTIYYVYYRTYVVSVPRVVCADEKRLAALKKHCPVFFEEFWPTFWAPQAHMQTVIRVVIQTFPKSKRER